MNYYCMICYGVILLLATLITAAHGSLANPLKNPEICGRPECYGHNTKFRYDAAKVYRYEYQLHVRSQFSGSGQNTSDVFLTAMVELTFPKKCEGIMRIHNTELKEEHVPYVEPNYDDYGYNMEEEEETFLHPESDKFAEDIQRNYMRFSFQDGIIGELCPNEFEPTWVLNFKKGILSAMQNSMLRFDMDYNTTETDISGTCNVDYMLTEKEDTSLWIKKTKDIPSCKYRYKTQSILQTTPYEFRQNYAAWPLLQSESYCNISIDHHISERVICYERHQLLPFSNERNGAVTESTLTLRLAKEEENVYETEKLGPVMRRSNLIYDHTPSPKVPHGEIKAARDLLVKLCELGFPDIKRGFPDVFTEFLTTARLLTYSTLEQLLIRSTSICENGKNHVLESLPYIGSSASVQIMKEQIVGNLIPTVVAHSWMSSLSFMTRPSPDILNTVYDLMEYGKQHNKHDFTLSTSAIAHTFCKQNPNCQRLEEIQKIVDYLEEDIIYYLDKTEGNRVNEERVLVSIKAIGNIGIITKRFENVLKEVIEDESKLLEIRLQAVSAFRRYDCVLTKDYFLQIYRNFSAQPELRIAAYLQSMKCPDYISISTIKFVLETEEVNQVGSFVWSHLNNVAKSASPVRIELQGLLVGGDLGSKYKMDIRKFSRNYEQSIFFDEYNFGANAESNLIFGTESYLPRTLSLNFTFDLFGESVNLLELNTRMQGFEKFVESHFGPKGPLNAKRFSKKYDDFLTHLQNIFSEDNLPSLTDLPDLNEYNNPAHIIEKAKEIQDDIINEIESDEDDYVENETDELRLQRASPAKASLKKKIDDLGYDVKYNFKEPKASLGIKIFGNDLQYHTLEGVQEVFQEAAKFNPDYIKKLLTETETFYTKSGIILDASYTVPLSSGLPLSLSALGVSSVDIRLSGKYENPGFQKTQKLDIEAKIKPSVSVDILTSMQSDFFYGAAGIRVKSNLYSSSSIETKLKVRGLRLVSLHVHLPQDRNEIFSAKTELLVVKYGETIPQAGIEKRYTNTTCTWPVINRAIGLKICSDYQMPDVSNSKDYPSLILAGPANLDIHLDKADLTAKSYVFEYRSDKNRFGSQKSFTFETPGSAISRTIIANITSDHEIHNATISFEHGDERHLAVGSYKDTPNEKNLQLAIQLNGKEAVALQMGYNRTYIKNGALFFPKFFLIIQNEKVAGLTGTIKKIDKNEKLQYDVDLTFETKKLQSKVLGYISKTEATYLANLNFNYKFDKATVQYLHVEAGFADRSQKGRNNMKGDFMLTSTMYPEYNFKSNLTLQRALGHVEVALNVNNAPDLTDPNYNLGIKLTFARFLEHYFKRTMGSIQVARPKSNIDLVFAVKHDERFKNGTENNFYGLLRYGPKKEATAKLSVYQPLSVLYKLSVEMNITMPGFSPCTALMNINEMDRRVYDLNFKGTWFNNHSIDVQGFYNDRSSYAKTYHHLKLNVLSPSFNDTKIDAIYVRDEQEFKMDILVEHGVIPYGVIFHNKHVSVVQRLTYGELNWRKQLYSITANLTSGQQKQLIVDIHIDKERDINIVLRGQSNDLKKEAAVELKWNANRDPSQKVAIAAEFNTPRHRAYHGLFLVTYPNRSFNGMFEWFMDGPGYRGISRVAWSPTEVIEWKFDSGAKLTDEKKIWVLTTITTPFEGWRNNLLQAGFFYYMQSLRLNTSMVWAEINNLEADMFGDYRLTDTTLNFEFKASLNSTIKNVPTISAYIKHSQNESKINTDAEFKKLPYNDTLQVFSVRSSWNFKNDIVFRNISGSLAIRSPYDGYKQGVLVTKFSFNKNKELIGAADFELEHLKYTLLVAGHIKKITDNMLTINVTTPIEKFQKLAGRFGINEREKHAVAEIRAPTMALGVEGLFSIISSTDFDVKFSAETPMDIFQKCMIIAKKKSKTIDFRGAWNKNLLGFTGVWRLASTYDFEYSYKVFIPLKNFEENGVVARHIRNEALDLEMTVKLAQYKVGLLLVGKPKLKLIEDLDMQTPFKVYTDLFKDELPPPPPRTIDPDYDYEYSDEELETQDTTNLLSYSVDMELDTLVWSTIKGDVRLVEAQFTYMAAGKLEIPHGVINFRDRFYFRDIRSIQNEAIITTPFASFKEIKSVYQSSMNVLKQYTIGLDVSYKDNLKWHETGFYLNFTNATDHADYRLRDITFKLKTALENLPRLNMNLVLERDDTAYRANFTGNTVFTSLMLTGALDHDTNYVDANIGFALATPLIANYSCNIFFKKDFSHAENVVDVGFNLVDKGIENNVKLETMWNILKGNHLKAKLKFTTNLLPITVVQCECLASVHPNPHTSIDMFYIDDSEVPSYLKFRANRKKDLVVIDLNTPLEDYRNISVSVTLTEKQANSGSYAVLGSLYRNSDIYQITGHTELDGDLPVRIDLVFRKNKADNNLGAIQYKLIDDDNIRSINARVFRGTHFAQFNGSFFYESSTNWKNFVLFKSSEPEVSEIKANFTSISERPGQITNELTLETPWTRLGIDSANIVTNILIGAYSGEMTNSYNHAQVKSWSKAAWTWLAGENMQVAVESRTDRKGFEPKSFDASAKYLNPAKDLSRITFGAMLDVNNIWTIGTNGSISMEEEKISSLIVSLPEPAAEVHRLTSRLRGIPNFDDTTFEIKYETDVSKSRYSAKGQYRNSTDLQGLIRVEWGLDPKADAAEAHMQMLRKGVRREFSGILKTPFYIAEDTFKTSGSYDIESPYDRYTTIIYLPESRKVADVDVSFENLSNAKGRINCTTPFVNMTWMQADFSLSAKPGEDLKYVKVTWPNDMAILDSKVVYSDISNNLDGSISVEVPIDTRHIINVIYNLKEEDSFRHGNASVVYNEEQVIDGHYVFKTEIEQEVITDAVDISLKNRWKPLGIHYRHAYDSELKPTDTTDFKRVEFFELEHSDKFNITGEFHNRTTATGQEFKIVAMHPNRTVVLTADFDYKDDVKIQRSKLELSPKVWFAYDFNSHNKTEDDKETQIYSLEISYPKRNITAEGWYSSSSHEFDSIVELKWVKNPKPVDTESSQSEEYDDDEDVGEPKVMSATFAWRNNTPSFEDETNHTIRLELVHPSFEKNVSFKGSYAKTPIDFFRTAFEVEYNDDEYHLLRFGGGIQDLSSIVNYRNYSVNGYAYHEASELEFDARSTIRITPGVYGIYNNGLYKQGFRVKQIVVVDGKVNINEKDVYYCKTSPTEKNLYWLRADGDYPIYTVNSTVEEEESEMLRRYFNTEFYLNIDDKLIRLHTNMTPDGTQNLQMFGTIPDARSAHFDIWREFEDIRVVDVTSYVRMNHSRLITSHSMWRPSIRSEINGYIKERVFEFYKQMSNSLEDWKKTLQSEFFDATRAIWIEAKPNVQDFLDDVGKLNVIQDDLEDLRLFLNSSYEADDFYVRSVVNFTLTILDEFAIKNHIESVPKIFRELLEAMGESGQDLRELIDKLIETIKNSYQNVVELIGKLLHGETFEQVSEVMESIINKYDNWIKDLHLSLIRHVEDLYVRLMNSLTSAWQQLLVSIEPTLVQLAHYVESTSWTLAKEVMDFLYERSHDLVDSAYFNQSSNLMNDLDGLYRDIQENDALTNIKKYSALGWNFLKNKYFELVPFGKELNDIVMELYSEIQSLQDLAAIQFIKAKINEIKDEILWVADEFKLEQRLMNIWEMVRYKLVHYAQTALQADSHYREAKTKFVFDPDTGIIDLEQKLPMSWHAFNETPKFEEIPEYKMIHDVQEFLSGSNETIWAFYHELKPLMDPGMWLPPIKSHAFLLGSRHYITFDQKFISLDLKYEIIDGSRKLNQCSYLLAKDFVDSNFTLVLEPTTAVNKKDEIIASRRFSLIADDDWIAIEIVGDSLRIGNNLTAVLPIRIKDVLIYRNADVVFVESLNGFKIICNIQFDYCSFELAGWYYGKTAGLLGTMNNEQYDEYLKSDHHVTHSKEDFVKSWQLSSCDEPNHIANVADNMKLYSSEILTICDSYFINKFSYFASCFPVIDPTPFYEMCLDLGLNSKSSVIHDEHPSERGICTSALAYVDVCSAANSPLRVPTICVHCELINGSYVPEGETLIIKDEAVVHTTDVVFIVEAKPCNKDITEVKSINTLVSSLNDELESAGIKNNRYSVVAYGGASPFDVPRSVVYNSTIFTSDPRNVYHYFNHIKTSQGKNNDIFGAIITALQLIFRPGASKTFILIPCSECKSETMKLDYSSILQLLIENGVNLHILMDADFVFDKVRLNRIFFGIDRHHAYSKSDFKDFKGDVEMRKQVRLPKKTLGVCAPLAIETNGTVFTARKLRVDKSVKNPIKKLSTVFAKRVAQSAMPNSCQSCECTGHNTGIAYMTCSPCAFIDGIDIDYDFEEGSEESNEGDDWIENDYEDFDKFFVD